MIIDSKYGSVYIIRVATSSLMVRYKGVKGDINNCFSSNNAYILVSIVK